MSHKSLFLSVALFLSLQSAPFLASQESQQPGDVTSVPTEEMLYEGFTVDLVFEVPGPGFGDLLLISGQESPSFRPSGAFDFRGLDDLRFSQVDDAFGVKATGEGDDVAVWLFPLVEGQAVSQHPGPFDGLRLHYNVLRNPESRFSHYLLVLQRLQERLPVEPIYRSRGDLDPTSSGLVEQLQSDFVAVQRYWQNAGITLGSSKALEVDF